VIGPYFHEIGDRFFEIVLPKFLAKILAFVAQTTDIFLKKIIITLVFEKNANFFAGNWQKSQTFVIITSILGLKTLGSLLFGLKNDYLT
jgi:hypothetical protein